ncbi:hypothetical protein [Leptolyngbya sp. PCC 6406]|uniref:hypothetical protein n=1 Tax=Leptolyngbya sp. PCC 6406 TaxID=1173264 RepID=UPI0002AD1ACE|nr:hypothetical protein [Leptolyngbya sp. PCC 6406]
MTAKEQLLQELEQTPDFLIQEVLDFLCFLKLKHPTVPNAPLGVTNALRHLQHLGDIGRRQPSIDAVALSRHSRNDLEHRSLM